MYTIINKFDTTIMRSDCFTGESPGDDTYPLEKLSSSLRVWSTVACGSDISASPRYLREVPARS